MSLYNDASLVMIPSAYKDGKLYSIKPTDGSGDFTFTRGSNLAATRVNSSGLIEKGRENLLLQSNGFDTTWTTSNSISVLGSQSGYDGSSDAWLLQQNAANGNLRQTTSSVSGIVTYSIYAKPNSLNAILLLLKQTSDAYAYFDLSDGSLLSNANLIDSSSVQLSNGWYRVSITVNVSALTQVRIYPSQDSDTSITSGNIYIQDAQLEVGLVATDYIETTTTTEVAGITEDLPRLDYSGSCPSLLLEPQRTNLITQSEYFEDTNWVTALSNVTPNEAVSPEGVQNAYKLITTASTGNHQIDAENITISSGALTGSVFAKKGANADWLRLRLSGTSNPPRAWFDLENGVVGDVDASGSATIEDYGNGWYRCSLTEAGNTASGGGGRLQIFINESNSQTGFNADGDEYHYIYGAQFELGSYPTSYIPTYGSQVTRSEEFNNTSFAGIETEGTLFGEVEVVNTGSYGTPMALSFNDFTSNFILVYKTNTNALSARIRFGGLDQCSITSGTLTEGYHKFAFTYREDDCEFFVDGVSIGTDTSVSIPTSLNVIRQNIGAATNPFEGGTKQLVYFPTALTDSEAIALTTL